ncbi:hypothetical protein BH11MYX2_BH11MYX2_35710 [soil metagenome]
MGLLDKVKAFAGGKGMAKVTISVIEKQPAENATFPVTDSVLKGTMVIEALQPCVLLATKYEVWLNIAEDPADETGSPNLVATSMDPDPNTSYVDPPFEYPLDMKPGQIVERSWLVMDVDLAKVLAKNGYSEPHEAIGDKRVRLVVKCIADVKGSPFDPSADVEIQLTP